MGNQGLEKLKLAAMIVQQNEPEPRQCNNHPHKPEGVPLQSARTASLGTSPEQVVGFGTRLSGRHNAFHTTQLSLYATARCLQRTAVCMLIS